MAINLVEVKGLTIEAENQARVMVDAINQFERGRFRVGTVTVTMSAAQKTTVKTQYTDALAVLKTAVADIDKERVI